MNPSLVVATLVGGIESLALVSDKLALRGRFLDGISTLASNFGSLGYLILGIFAASWVIAAVIYRLKGYHMLDTVESRAE